MILDNGTTIHLTRTFNTDVGTLFSCFSDEKAWTSWWKGLDEMKMDFKEGGEIFFSWRQSKATKIGKILEIKPNEQIRFTWNSDGPTEDLDDTCTMMVKDTEVTLQFASLENGKSELQLIHNLKKKEHNLNAHYEGWTWALLDLDNKFNQEIRSKQEEFSIEIERVFKAPINRVYELWTQPELLNKWFNSKKGTEHYTYSKLKEKDCYALDYHDVEGKETGIPGAVHRVIGEYKEIIPNKKLVFSWVDENFNYESYVTVRFQEVGTDTKVNLVHSNVYEKDWIERFNEGWNDCFDAQVNMLAQ